MGDSRQEQLNKIKGKYTTEGGQNVEDYNPHDYRETPHGTNFGETLIHVLKASLGTGILAMPEAFKHAGIINGFLFTVIIGVVCTYGLHLLIRSQYVICKRLRVPYLSYPVAMKAALMYGPESFAKFGTLAQILVDTFLIVYQTGACSVYIIFVSANILKLTNPYLEEPLSIEAYILMLFPFFIFILSIPNLKWLAPFSLLSNVLTFITFGILLYFIFEALPSLDGVSYFGDIKKFPLFVGTCLFAVAAVGCITSVEKNMQHPSQFLLRYGILNISMTVIVVTYALLGFLGYWRWKEVVCSSVTLNLQRSTASKLIQGMYAVAIYISYALNGYVPVDIIWNTYVSQEYHDSKYKLLWEYLIRFGIVLLTFVLAVSVPLLGLIISLFGAVCIPALELIFPALMDICVKYPDQFGKGKWVVITDVLMILGGLIGIFSGAYTSIYEIVKELHKKHTAPGKSMICADE
ncbi:hypothetical protein ILUMI_23547 [Ignelater luminosus]|uniref:Amino acid transporter transmembrane domain-containing protein n=1 Tax=Ignelater luminosus TaxID=2038154 RepID=A0A8K0CBV3_IGNLU|nr:hypothetical protein ILUMI_23547 [Ignelater luminosus]